MTAKTTSSLGDDLRPGRELDALVAEKVMGREYKPEHEDIYWREKTIYEGRQRGETIKSIAEGMGLSASRVRQLEKNWERRLQKSLPHFSTDIAAAWEVVEKLRLIVRPSVIRDRWVASRFLRVYLSGQAEGDCEATGETAAHAICLAALKAMS